MAKKNIEPSFKTVGDVLDALSKYDRNQKIFGTQYHECITDAGSDLGGSEEHKIRGVYDLESRVIIDIYHYDY